MSLTGPRPARSDEIPDVIELANSVFRPEGEGSMGDEYPLLYADENAANLRVFVDDDVPVALVGMVEREISLLGTRHLCCEIGSVCTHPDYRGRGLATRLMHDARRRALEDGCDLCLISGGRGLYRRLGYVEVGSYVQLTVRAENLPQEPGVENRPRAENDLPELVKLHAAEPVRFVRPPEDFQTLLEGGCTLNGRAETRLLFAGETAPRAYVMYRPPGSRGVEGNELCIDELAGSRLAVARSLPALFAEYCLDHVKIEGLASDHELTAIAAARGWTLQRRGFHGTVGIIDPAVFWQNTMPLLQEYLGKEAGALSLCADGESVRLSFQGQSTDPLDMPRFTRLVFLPEHKRHELDPGLPDDSPLGDVLDRVFPLPLVSYGLNYV